MPEEHSIGQLVLIHDPQLAESLGRAGESAVVLQRRRGGARIGFLSDGGNAWVDDRRLYPLSSAAEGATLLDTVSQALSCLQAEEVELDDLTERGITLHVRCLAFEDAELHTLMERLGERLGSWRILPYGMASIVVDLEIRVP